MGKNLNVPKHIASGPGERIDVTVLKRRQRIEKVHLDKVRHGEENRRLRADSKRKPAKGTKAQRKEALSKVFKNARDLMNNYKRRLGERKKLAGRQRGAEKKEKRATVEEKQGGSLVFVIRAQGQDVPMAAQRVLTNWELKRMHEGRLLSVSDAVVRDINVLRGFVRWGFPETAHVAQLLRTRGYVFDDNGLRVPLSGNIEIEKRLGKDNIICIEDLEHAIVNRTEHMQKCLDIVAPFRLDPPARDPSEFARRARDKKASIGQNTFSAYMAKALPDLPALRDGNDEGLGNSVARQLSYEVRRRGPDREGTRPAPPRSPALTVNGKENARAKRMRLRKEAREGGAKPAASPKASPSKTKAAAGAKASPKPSPKAAPSKAKAADGAEKRKRSSSAPSAAKRPRAKK